MTILAEYGPLVKDYTLLRRSVSKNGIGENTLNFTEIAIKGVLLEDANFYRKSGEQNGQGGASYTEGRLYIVTTSEVLKDDKIREEGVDTYRVAKVKPVYDIDTGKLDHYKAFLVDID